MPPWAHLQVGGVGQEGQVHALARDSGPVVGCAQVVLDIACAVVLSPRGHSPPKLGKDLLHRLAHDVGQDVQAPCTPGERLHAPLAQCGLIVDHTDDLCLGLHAC